MVAASDSYCGVRFVQEAIMYTLGRAIAQANYSGEFVRFLFEGCGLYFWAVVFTSLQHSVEFFVESVRIATWRICV